MRYRITFLAGLAVGYIVGTRAGRERYEQMVKATRKVVENPTVQRTARSAGSKATEFTKAAGQKATEQVPKLTETAKSTAKSSATKVRGQLDRIPGLHSGETEPAGTNGDRPAD